VSTLVRALLLAALLVPPATYADAGANMDEELDYLLATVGESDCTFIRNGKAHDAAAAREHLALKRRRGKKYFSTAEEFIDRLASSSSWTGKPYHIRCGDEDSLAKDWFAARLDDYRKQPR